MICAAGGDGLPRLTHSYMCVVADPVDQLELHQHRVFKNIRNLETAKYRPHPKTISQLRKTKALI